MHYDQYQNNVKVSMWAGTVALFEMDKSLLIHNGIINEHETFQVFFHQDSLITIIFKKASGKYRKVKESFCVTNRHTKPDNLPAQASGGEDLTDSSHASSNQLSSQTDSNDVENDSMRHETDSEFSSICSTFVRTHTHKEENRTVPEITKPALTSVKVVCDSRIPSLTII